jgi:hypothetical protein
LRYLRLSKQTVGWLANAVNLCRLSRFALTYSWVDGSGLAALVNGRQFNGLVSLSFPSCQITTPMIRLLVRQPGVARIRELDLYENHIGYAGAAALIESPNLGSLRALNLEGQQFGPEVEERLRQRFPFVRLSLRRDI